MGEIIDTELEDFVKSHADDIVKEAAKMIWFHSPLILILH